jgi:putative redox protein
MGGGGLDGRQPSIPRSPKSCGPKAVRSTRSRTARADGPRRLAQHAGHRFSTDAYPAFGGQDAAPSPLFYALGSLTSCNQVTATLVAKDLGIRLGNWSFEVQGDLDTSVLVGGADGNANFDRVTVHATVETDATDEQLATLVAETERRCPVTQLFKRSGVEWDNQWENAPLPRTG